MPDNTDFNTYVGGAPITAGDIRKDYEQAQADPIKYWWDMMTGQNVNGRITAAGGYGFNPTRAPNEARALAQSMQLAPDIQNAGANDAILRAGLAREDRRNPYDPIVADQSRAAQLALMQQMRGQMSGPSIAAMQGQRAMGQSGQQALGAAAMGAPGRAAMMQAGQVGGGMAGDIGQARLAEVMRAQAGMGGLAGGLRGADQRSAEAQMRQGIDMRGMDDNMRRFYASQGANLQNARDQNLANREITRLQQLSKANQQDVQNVKDVAGAAASMFSLGL
jgi:hypothetical protein